MRDLNSKSSQYNTILVIVLGFVILSKLTELSILFPIGTGIGIISLVSKKAAHWIVVGWDLLAKGLSYIVPNILLGSIFYFFLTPMAFLARLLSKEDALILKNNVDTVFKSRNKKFDKSSFEKMW